MKDINEKSKKLSYLLRHDTEGFKLGKIDSEGWRNVIELCKDHGFSLQELQEIVLNDSKGRYEFDEENLHIRACQGHSIPVDVCSIKEEIPPDFLYHGTPEKNKDSILKKGLLKGSRLYVHLSDDYDTAFNVGKRRPGPTIVLMVRAAEMYKDGIKFWKSKNGVWLCDYVDSKYIMI